MQKAIEYRKFVGHMLSPDDAYRLQTQLSSFELRFTRQCENAMRLAAMLHASPFIERVLYPGLGSHETHHTATEILGGKGYGAMITFDLAGKTAEEKRSRRDRFIERVYPEIRLIPTLGDSHTILMPVDAVWGHKYHEPGMIRMSLGFEPWEEVERVIRRGLQM
jgi:cystathionine beta-lyase/cystathionine gamma-synthase